MLLTRSLGFHKNTLYMTVKKRGKMVDIAGVGPLNREDVSQDYLQCTSTM